MRRHKRWLYSVVANELTGQGDAVTLTVRRCPPSERDWRRTVKALLDALRDEDLTRWHWVVEWQERKVPHLHMPVYAPEGGRSPGLTAVAAWLDLASEYGPSAAGQHVTPITGAVGWLKYLSKHASRGVAHYQRQGKPRGWETTGRLWGYGGHWPIAEPVEGRADIQTMWRVRRWVQGYAIAQARSEAVRYGAIDPKKAASCWDSVSYLRQLRKCPDRALSSVRGLSEWVPGDLFLEMVQAAGWDGEVAA